MQFDVDGSCPFLWLAFITNWAICLTFWKKEIFNYLLLFPPCFSGIQYMINEKTSNCSIQGIPLTALDAVPAENQHIRLRHASELISIDPNMFIYKGTVSEKLKNWLQI